jgi:hypothetical protein
MDMLTSTGPRSGGKGAEAVFASAGGWFCFLKGGPKPGGFSLLFLFLFLLLFLTRQLSG